MMLYIWCLSEVRLSWDRNRGCSVSDMLLAVMLTANRSPASWPAVLARTAKLAYCKIPLGLLTSR